MFCSSFFTYRGFFTFFVTRKQTTAHTAIAPKTAPIIHNLLDLLSSLTLFDVHAELDKLKHFPFTIQILSCKKQISNNWPTKRRINKQTS